MLEKLKEKRIWLIGVIVVAVIAAAVGLMMRTPSVEAIRVQPGTYEEVIAGVGYVAYDQKITLKAEVGGRVESVSGDEGDVLGKGDTVVQFDDEKAQLNLSSAQTNLSLAQARYADFQTSYQSSLSNYANQVGAKQKSLESEQTRYAALLDQIADTQILVDGGVVAQSELDDLLTQKTAEEATIAAMEKEIAAVSRPEQTVAELNVSIDAASVQVDQAQVTLSDYQVDMPFDGVILQRFADPGDYVSAGQDLLTVGSSGKKHIEVALDESYLSRLSVGQAVTLIPSAYEGERRAGKIVKIAPIVDADTGTVKVTVSIEEDEALFLENMSVRVEIDAVTRADVLVIPNAYLLPQTGGTYVVYKVSDDGTIQSGPVEVFSGETANVWVESGIAEGDLLVLPSDASPGETVRVQVKGDEGL